MFKSRLKSNSQLRTQTRKQQVLKIITITLGACITTAAIYFWNGPPETVVTRFITAYQMRDAATARRLGLYNFLSMGNPLNFNDEYLRARNADPLNLKPGTPSGYQTHLYFPTGTTFKLNGRGVETAGYQNGSLYVDVIRQASPNQLRELPTDGLSPDKWYLYWGVQQNRHALDQLLGVKLAVALIPNNCPERNYQYAFAPCGESTKLEIPTKSVLGAYATGMTKPDTQTFTTWLTNPPQANTNALARVKALIAAMQNTNVESKKKSFRDQALNLIVNDLGDVMAYFSLTLEFHPDPESGKYFSEFRFYIKQFLHIAVVDRFLWIPLKPSA